MSFLQRLFAKKQEEDYETILSNLANDVQKRQVKLSEIRLRERRSTLVVTMYTMAAWVAYVSLWYMNALPSARDVRNVKIEKAVKGIPVVVGPVIILFIRRIVQIWYERKGNAEEKALKEVMKQRREKVEEIKKKTNYYSTRDLLQKYDDASPMETPMRRPNGPLPQPNNPLATPQRGPMPPGSRPQVDPRLQTPNPNKAIDPRLIALSPAYPVAPPRKQWYDKVADALLGDDDQSFQSPSSRYALICEKCFSHNGLVKESMWEDAQYVCPKCHHFNASARSRKQGKTLSPSTPAGISRIPSKSPSPIAASLPSSPAQPDGDLPTVDKDVSYMEVDQ